MVGLGEGGAPSVESVGKFRRRFVAWGLTVAVIAWLVAAPSWIGRFVVSRAVLARLNDPQAGISCRDVSVSFGYRDLVRHLRVSRLEISGLTMNLAPRLGGAAERLFTERAVTLDATLISRASRSGMALDVSGRALGVPFSASGWLTAAWSTNIVEATGRLRLAYGVGGEEEGWCVGETTVSATPVGWSADVMVPEFAFSHADTVLGPIVSRLAIANVSNLVFSGRASLNARAERTRAVPVAAWCAAAKIRDLSASATVAGTALALEGGATSLAAEGRADLVIPKPVGLRARSLTGGGLRLDEFYASLRMDDRRFLVTEAGAELFGGSARLYAFILDPTHLNAGFTLFVDDIDAGCVFARLPGFRGTASGRLHGKLPIYLQDGCRLRLRDAFLYSTPGETGTLRLEDPAPLIDNLTAGGVSKEVCANVAKALRNLDYEVLRLKLARENGEDASLAVKVRGSASDGKVSVPVDFEVTFHGALEQLVNFGLGAAIGGGAGKEK